VKERIESWIAGAGIAMMISVGRLLLGVLSPSSLNERWIETFNFGTIETGMYSESF